MEYGAVLESRKWHSQALGCTYAIISLPGNASFAPPKQWLNEIAWYKTPVVFDKEAKNYYCHNLICNCEGELDSKTMGRLSSLLSNPGSFYYFHNHRPPHSYMWQGVIYIYSKPEKLAAMVRFGD